MFLKYAVEPVNSLLFRKHKPDDEVVKVERKEVLGASEYVVLKDVEECCRHGRFPKIASTDIVTIQHGCPAGQESYETSKGRALSRCGRSVEYRDLHFLHRTSALTFGASSDVKCRALL